jgi:hypothetical protein
MRAQLMLADSAQAIEGKLYILGGGWTITGPDPAPFAIAVLMEVDWDETNERHTFGMNLLTEDGKPVQGPGNEAGIRVEGTFEVGRPPGVRPGSTFNFPVAVNVAPLALSPGQRFVWQLSIDGETRPTWRVAFDTRPRPVEGTGPATPS